MRNYRIVFTATENIGGNLVDVERGTKWMTEDEIQASNFLNERNAKIVKREE